jgi:hypothetical protein
VIWTAHTGHTYTTTAGGSFFFPQLAIRIGELISRPTTGPPNPNRPQMPTRRKYEARLAATCEPPPF